MGGYNSEVVGFCGEQIHQSEPRYSFLVRYGVRKKYTKEKGDVRVRVRVRVIQSTFFSK